MHISHSSPKPELVHVTAVASSILSLEIHEGWIEGGVQEPYAPREGETLENDKNNPYLVWIMKDGKRIGIKVPDPRFGDKRYPLEKVCGDKLDIHLADAADSYLLNGKNPAKVFRKTKQNNFADGPCEMTLEHMVYLLFEDDLVPGEDYTLTFPEGMLDKNEYSFRFDPRTMRSEAVHVTQVGFRPDDPAKRGYLSQWMGLGGGILYTGVKTFEVIDEENHCVFEGKVRLASDGLPVPVNNSAITVGSAVYELDFSAFQKCGTYRLSVPGIGCSFPFSIGEENTWLRGFKASMNGLYCQRSGIVTGKPYSRFERPRCYHPNDGKKIYHSDCSLFESGNGLNCYGTDHNNFGNLVRKATTVEVKNAWGGYFDACDWDRRIQHLHATLMGEELYLMFPDFFDALKLSIPESGNGLPDILNEGLYNIDHYRRMQTPEGGIRGGVEQVEHPILGQCGWQDSWTSYAYAPDFWSAYYYTAAAARAAYALRRSDRNLADVYEESAVRAFDWAEKEYAEKLASEGHSWTRRAKAGAIRQRELAAVDLFRLTGRKDCDEIYRALRDPKSYEAAFVYATLPAGVGDPAVKQACVKTIVDAAERSVSFASKTPFRLTTPDPESTRTGPYASFYTIPHNVELMRAHYLTGDPRYLASAIDAAQFAAGANPTNMCYTTGVGIKGPVNILHHDSRLTGQDAPDGITIFGPHDWNNTNGELLFALRDGRLYPGAYSWPGAESYLDIYRYPCENEYTVQESIGPNAYNWGYLAARNAL
ncbi:MAG: glycoside hydrolase family 9 protein [Clostridia bacterium]|nr:glycoside hydrolase family 9 protein [Clostridia bacterium]